MISELADAEASAADGFYMLIEFENDMPLPKKGRISISAKTKMTTANAVLVASLQTLITKLDIRRYIRGKQGKA